MLLIKPLNSKFKNKSGVILYLSYFQLIPLGNQSQKESVSPFWKFSQICGPDYPAEEAN